MNVLERRTTGLSWQQEKNRLLTDIFFVFNMLSWKYMDNCGSNFQDTLYIVQARWDYPEYRNDLYHAVLTLFAIAFNPSTKLFKRPIYHEHRDSMPLTWWVFKYFCRLNKRYCKKVY